MSIVNPDKVTDFKVTEGSLDCERISVLNGYGEEQKLFKNNPQTSKTVSINKAGLITPDTGYSYMESVTVTNTAPVGEDRVGVIKSTRENGGIFEAIRYLSSKLCYPHNIIFVKDGAVQTKLKIGETYQNALYPTDSWTVHSASWAVGRSTESENEPITSNNATCLEKNNDGKVSLWEPEQHGDIDITSIPYTYKSFEA